jgi:hypothetical protein
MILPYLTYIFFTLAGCSNAFMDTFLFRADRSIFKKWGIEKLSPMFTYLTHKNFLGIVRLDPWHIAKFVWLGFMTLSLVSASEFGAAFGWWGVLNLSLSYAGFWI